MRRALRSIHEQEYILSTLANQLKIKKPVDKSRSLQGIYKSIDEQCLQKRGVE